MSQTDTGVTPGASSPLASTADGVHTIMPNQYHLHGADLMVSYFPDGFGPIRPGDAGARFTYQDNHESLAFSGGNIRTLSIPDLGTIVSVTIVATVDVGNTTFTLLVPAVNLTNQIGASAPIRTEGITTVHRAFVAQIGHAQAETYRVTPLTGTAVNGILPV